MQHSKRPVLLVAALFCFAATQAGCAFMRASSARQRYVRDQTSQWVYRQPIQQVWPGVRKVLFERGLQVKDSDSGGAYAVETEPANDGKTVVRFLVQGTKLDDGACRLEVTKMTMGKDGAQSERDTDFEWQLLQRLDPQGAAQINAAAEQEAERAKNAS